MRSSGLPLTGGTGRVLLLFVVLSLLVTPALVFLARAPPPIPMTTQGTALDRAGSPLPQGTPVRTFIDGVDYSNGSSVSDALGDYAVATAGNLVVNATTPEPAPVKEGANLGETVVYAASDFTASAEVYQETLPWYPDRTVTQTLHLGSAASTPQPLKIQGVVTQPARGGPGYVLLCNPTANAASLSDYYLQVDAPGTYYGGNQTLTGSLAAGAQALENLTPALPVVPTGDALKLVYRNPGGASASAGGLDIVVDRVEFNATAGGTLYWQPGATVMGSAPAPGPGEILERSSSCADTNSPSDFHLAPEPGLPAATSPVVAITAPGVGQSLSGGQTFTFRWNLTDNVFEGAYLRVWVNVTYQGTTTPLLAGTAGATSVDWSVPDVSAPGSILRVDVVNPLGLHGSAVRTFDIVPATPYSAYVALLVVVVIAAFILLAYRHAKWQEPGGPKAAPPPAPPSISPPPAGAPPPAAAAPPAGNKACPRCGTVVRATDETCFFCGAPFEKPPA